jgi:hypothetical protein
MAPGEVEESDLDEMIKVSRENLRMRVSKFKTRSKKDI